MRRVTEDATRERFRLHLRRGLEARLELPVGRLDGATDAQLCERYRRLARARRAGLFPGIIRAMGLDGQWAAKHFQNAFTKAQYAGRLDREAKQLVVALIAEHGAADKAHIARAVKAQLLGRGIFPGTLDSFIYQRLRRLAREPQAGGHDAIRENDSDGALDLAGADGGHPPDTSSAGTGHDFQEQSMDLLQFGQSFEFS